MQILLLGKLGDACRKLSELELLQEQETNKILESEIACFKTAIETWPLSDPTVDRAVVETLRTQLKINFSKLKELEEDVLSKSIIPEVLTEEHFYVIRSASLNYLNVVRDCRHIIGNINALGSMYFVLDQAIPLPEENQNGVRESNLIPDRQQCSSSVPASESEGEQVVSAVEQRDIEA